MIFQLALLILRGIMEPDQITDKKSGAGTFVKRVIISLTLLTVLTPISIPNPANDYERQLNNNGLLFGTLYSLQERILENNTLGRLILGTNNAYSSEDAVVSTTGIESEDKTSQDLKQAADIFSSTILKGFVRINLHPKWEEYYVDNGKQPETQNECRMCKNISDPAIEEYKKWDSDPSKILDYVNEEVCKPDNIEAGILSKKRFAFTYRPLIAGIVALVFVAILLSFTIDVVVRGVKLVILRLLAPIPIISYMDPKGSKDSALSAWTKQLISTYLDLFLRLALVYFALALIQDMIKKGIGMNTGNGLIAILSYVLIFIGIFVFAKDAPKFIREVLGLKGEGGKLFGGLSAAMGIGAAATGAISGFRVGREASRNADIMNNPDNPTAPDRILNRGKHLLAGMAGGALGMKTGVQASWGAKDHQAKAAFDAIQKRNATEIARGLNGSTLRGRIGTNFHRAMYGESAYDKQTREINKLKGISSAAKDLQGYLEDQGRKKGANEQITLAGRYSGTLNEFLNERKSAIQLGQKTFTVGNQTWETHGDVANKLEGDLIAQAGYIWAQQEMRSNNPDTPLQQKLDTFKDAGGMGYINDPENASKFPPGVEHSLHADSIKKVAKGASGDASKIEGSATYAKQKTDHGATGGK